MTNTLMAQLQTEGETPLKANKPQTEFPQIESILGVAKTRDGKLVFAVRFKKDSQTYSVTNEVMRDRYVKDLLNFYEHHIKLEKA